MGAIIRLVELLAILEVLQWTKTQNFRNLIIEPDCLQAIKMINEEELDPGIVECWLEGYQEFGNRF